MEVFAALFFDFFESLFYYLIHFYQKKSVNHKIVLYFKELSMVFFIDSNIRKIKNKSDNFLAVSLSSLTFSEVDWLCYQIKMLTWRGPYDKTCASIWLFYWMSLISRIFLFICSSLVNTRSFDRHSDHQISFTARSHLVFQKSNGSKAAKIN